MATKRQKLDGETDRLLLTIPSDLYARIQKLAEQSDITPQHFIKRILTEAAKEGVTYPAHAGIFESKANYGSKTKAAK